MLAFRIPGARADAMMDEPWKAGEGGQEVNAWLVIDPDDTVTIRVGQSEMGEGVFTAMPMLVAEELQCDWSKVRAVYADVNRHVQNTAEPYMVAAGAAKETDQLYQRMATGGSGAVRRSRQYLHQAGASARERLKQAAADAWGVERSAVTAADGVLSAGNHSGTFGEFAAAAAAVELESEPAIKTPDQFTLLGKSVPRLDTPLKTDGSAVYGIDVKLPDMVHAAVEASPVPGGRLVSFDFDAVKDRPGVIAAFRLGEGGIGKVGYNLDEVTNRTNGIVSGVAVVADTYYRALTALQLMPKEWDAGEPRRRERRQHHRGRPRGAWQSRTTRPTTPPSSEGDARGVIGAASDTVEASYVTPYLDHAVHGAPQLHRARDGGPGGHLDRDAEPAGGACRRRSRSRASRPEQVHLHNTFLGTGFGRRLRPDEVRQAAAIGAALGRPVKMVWTREENQRQGKLRPYSVYHFAASLDADKKPEAYWNRVVSHSIFNHLIPQFLKDGLDNQAMEGLDQRLPYRFPNRQVDYAIRDSHFPVQWWRSVGASQNAFALESFIDELAHAAGADPVEFRLGLMPEDSEFRRPLEVVAKEAGWTTDLRRGEGMGVGLAEAFGTIVARSPTSRSAGAGSSGWRPSTAPSTAATSSTRGSSRCRWRAPSCTGSPPRSTARSASRRVRWWRTTSTRISCCA